MFTNTNGKIIYTTLSEVKETINNRPNIFHWATSELSQDALICWLLSWANHKDDKEKPLRETAFYFLSKLTDHKLDRNPNIEIIKQYKNIDILVKINNEYAILIEDKTHTKNHSEQLERYYNTLSSEFPKEKIIPIYLKTGDQGEYNTVKNAGYKPFLRNDFIDVLEFALKSGVNNNIILDFYSHLTALEQSIQSYKTLPVSQWHWDSWKGFYTELARLLGDGNWSYVPQKNGGFLGFYWCWLYKEYNGNEFDYYLQLEHNKFCFKIYSYEREKSEEVREHYRSVLYQRAKQYNIDIYQNGRIGSYMTVAALSQSYLKINDDGLIDLDKTIELIKQIETMIHNI